MFATLKCITLRTVKYDDSRSIVTVWTRSHGRVALMVPAGQSREARRRRALMMPLGLFEGECDLRPGKQIHTIRDVRPLVVMPSLMSDPVKATVAMFLSETLERILRESMPDEQMTDFIFSSVEWLDSCAAAVGVANFPLVFLYRLGHFLGIAPDESSWQRGSVFDMQEGRFRRSAPMAGHWLDPRQTRGLMLLARMDYGVAARIRLPLAVRREMLDHILEYYTIHHVALTELRSLAVLRGS